MRIAGVTKKFADVVDLEDWEGTGRRGKPWDENIESPGLSLVSSWGDTQHVTMFLSWTSPGSKTIRVTGLKDQGYLFYLFDWISGEQLSTQEIEAVNGTLVLDQIPTREQRLVGYVTRKPVVERPKIRLVFRDAQGNIKAEVELEANQSYALDTSVIKPG
jgi:hypothetical protein